MSGIELATAYVSIVPSAEGMGANIANSLGGAGIGDAATKVGDDAGAKAASSFGGKWSAGLKVVALGTTAAAAGIGIAAVALGGKFDDAYDKIQVGTGESGAALDSLKDSFRNTLQAVPASFDGTSTAITSVNRVLGLTGTQLDERSAQFLELSRITGTDLAGNLDAATGVLNNFGIGADQQGGKLDILFRASQASGVAVADLSQQMTDSGSVLRSVGLDFDDSAALIAGLGKAGVSAAEVMPALGKTLAVAAKDGKNAGDVFTSIFDSIRDAPDDTTAASIAMESLGAKAGPKFAESVRSGKLAYDDLLGEIQGGSNTILGVGEDTADWGEKLQLLGNKLSVSLEPIATRVFNAVGTAVDIAASAFQSFFGFVEENQTLVISIAATVGTLLVGALIAYVAVQAVALYTTIALAIATNAWLLPLLVVIGVIALLVGAVIYAWNNFDGFREGVLIVWEAIKSAVASAWENVIKPAFEAISAFVTEDLLPALVTLKDAALVVWSAIATAISWAWETIIKPAWAVIAWYIENVLIRYVMLLWTVYSTAFKIIAAVVLWAWENVIKPAWEAISNYVTTYLIPYLQTLWAVAVAVWSGIVAAISWAWENVIKPVWDAIYGFIVNYLIPYYQMLWAVVQAVWSGISSAISTAWNTISGIFSSIVGGISWVAGMIGGIVSGIVNTFLGLPGSIRNALSGMWDFLGDQFRNIINGIVSLWNNLAIPSFTIGGWSTPFGDLPSWTTPRIDFPDIPRMHSGGFVPGRPGAEVLTVLQAGELVLPVEDVDPTGSPAARGGRGDVIFEAGAIVHPGASAYEVGEEFTFRTRAARR